jgi:predicted Zn-dependent protease
MRKLAFQWRPLRLISLLLLSVVLACAVNPVTGKKQFSLMSESQEIALGQESDPAIIAQFGLYENAALQQFINTKGQEMAKISHRPGLKYTFRILDSPVVNAFALPGGYVYFTRGIMAHFNDEAQFAGVLGHEIGHVTARHSAQQYSNQILGQALLLGGMLVSKELRAFGNEAQTAMSLMFLKYGRDHETQSDKLGVEYSTKVGYDAHEMADFFKTLKALGGDDGEVPTFLSTHPDPANRYENVLKLATEEQTKYPNTNFKVNRNSYLEMIDGIVYGEDPKQGYVSGGIFYHPELKFSFPIPANWKFANSPAQVQMAPSNGKALMIFTLVEGTSLQDAASKTASELQLTVTDSRSVTVNGLSGLEVLAQQVTQDQSTGQQSSILVKSLYVKLGNNIYVFHGVSTPADFQSYASTFDKTMFGFKQLTDQSKINVTPERIRIKSVANAGTLAQALTSLGVPSARHKELAVLNGMELSAKVTAGSKIKIVAK